MKNIITLAATLIFILATTNISHTQIVDTELQHTLYDIPPRFLVDLPTAGTLPKGTYNIGLQMFHDGGALGYTDIGLSHRFQLGISYGGTRIVSNDHPSWNPGIGFSLKFRVVDELEYFPAITVGFSDQGYGAFNSDWDRYTFKSRGFYAVTSRSFYAYKWTSGWHFGLNYSREHDRDDDEDVNYFGGLDAVFNYNLALAIEYDGALNDNSGASSEITGRGRGYLNMSIKWLFAENLELELIFKDLLINRRDAETLSRGVRLMYIDSF